jgi:hypothetical protein
LYPLFEFRLPSESYPTHPSQPVETDRLLSWTSAPFSTSGITVPLAAGFTFPLRSAFRVWLPSWRFPPCDPLPVLFRTGGAHGIRPSELSPLGRYPANYRSDGPTCRFSCRSSRRRSVGPARQAAAPGLLPFREFLATNRGISAAAAGCSLGIRPLRVRSRKPCPGFRPVSSHALLDRAPQDLIPAPQSLNRLSPAFFRATR